MSQKLGHSLGVFCPVSPRPIHALCLAAHSRFAKSETNALRLLHSEALNILGDSALIRILPDSFFPFGNIREPPLIQGLINSLEDKGTHLSFAGAKATKIANIDRTHCFSQSWFFDIFAELETTPNIQK